VFVYSTMLPECVLIDAPLPRHESERLKILRDYAILDSLKEEEFDRIAELASIICEAPISLVSFIDEDRQWLKSSYGLDINEAPRKQGICQYTILDSVIFEVEDASKDERFRNYPMVSGGFHVRFYAGFPLIDPEGFALGTICVIDHQPKTLTAKQKRALTLLAQDVMCLITERKAKANLRNFEKIFDFSNDLMFVGGIDGYFKKINPSFEKLLGWKMEHLLKMPHFAFLHPDDLESSKEELKKLTKGEVITNFVQRFRTFSGDYKYIQWTSTPELSTGTIYGIGRDITEKHQIQEDLHRTKLLLEQTSQVAKVGGWSFDVVQQKIAWTAITKEIHGVGADFEPNLDTAIDFYKPGESRERIVTALNLALTDGNAWDLQLQIVNVSGEEIWVEALGNAEFENGKCRRLYGTFRNINDQKCAELALKESIETQEKLNQVLIKQIEIIKEQDKTLEKVKELKFLADSIPEIIWTARADGFTDYYNQHWVNYTGMTVEETNQNGWFAVLHPEDADRCVTAWKESARNGNPYEVEYRLRRKSDGVYRWHLGRAVPMKAEDGSVIKWFGSCIDIDAYKKALNLENKISQFEDFNRIVAHNLRGPAGSIKMLLQMMNEPEADEQEKQSLLAMLEESSAALNKTLDQLMKVLEVRNNLSLPYVDCEFEEIALDIKQMLKGQFSAKKAILVTNFMHPVIKFPKIYLESIFYNMVSNSLKYSQENEFPQLQISSELVYDKIVLKFKDNGLGLDLEKHGNQLFKLNKTFHHGFDSKGVGLFMTKTQIETFGGQIRVESKPNHGSTFIVELPVI
jgi:PAS domain S-box-containing protein